MNLLQQTVYKSRYARFLDGEKRREHWNETVARYVEFIEKQVIKQGSKLTGQEAIDLYDAIFDMKCAPSMRLMMTAGLAVERDNIAAYNCAYTPIDSKRTFAEILYILMNGTGVGFSVERQYVNKLPLVPNELHPVSDTIVVQDSKLGWAKAYNKLINSLYEGDIPNVDYSKLRPAGARLRTFGGRSSGPAPLQRLFQFTVESFKRSTGRRLSSIEVHDIACTIGEVVVVGGVRRCLPAGSLVHTEVGMLPIEQVTKGVKVLTTKGFSPVANLFKQGKQALVRIVTQDGSLECTANHKVAVLTGHDTYKWVAASNLKIRDRLVAPSVEVGSISTSLPSFSYEKPKGSTTCKDITVPELDKGSSWLLGLIQGDGYVRLTEKSGEVAIPYHNDMPEIGERAKKELERYGVNVGESVYTNYKVLKVRSKQLASYFHSWLKQPKTTLVVPKFMWQSPTEIKLAYVAGVLDADGSIKTSPQQVVVTIYKEFAKELQLLLSSCGIQSRLKDSYKAKDDSLWKDKYSLSLINNKAKDKLNSSIAFKKFVTFRKEMFTNSYPGHFGHKSNTYAWAKTKYSLTPVEVVRIEKVSGLHETYDIEVEEQHEFFCNGYLVHNSALISLSNLTDRRMREAKVGAWWEDNKQRALANNSVCYTEKPDAETFLEEWTSLVKSKSGERGIFNRVAAQQQAAKYGRREASVDYGCNPCSEILLRPRQFCNLTEVICRHDDTVETLAQKVRVASILGTIQSTLTDFTFLSEEWKRNCEEERLLGVSLTGIFDNALLTSKEAPAILDQLREVAVATNKEWAARLGISESAAITCVKPSGTVSQLVDSSSGIHPRFSPYYIRNVRMDVKDPICKFLMEQGVVNEPDVVHPETQTVFSFPVASPESSEDMAAIQHLELWKVYQDHWCEHKPSITVLCEDKEWPEVGGWVYKHFDQISGVAFLPKSDHTYKQAPYIAISKEQYEELVAKTPKSVDWSKLIEEEDKTTASQELACNGNSCEII